MFNQLKISKMSNQVISDKVLTLLLAAKTIKGTSFIGVNNYTNAKGEVSNQTILGGILFANVLLNDFNALKDNKDTILKELEKSHPIALIDQAYNELLESLEKRLSSDEIKAELRSQGDATIMRSDAQIDAYIQLTKGVKLHKETLQIHVFGLVVRKKVIIPIEYKAVNSRELTIVKNKIQKLCDFKQAKYRTFIFEQGGINLQGVTIPNELKAV
jgi:hypothetical protein